MGVRNHMRWTRCLPMSMLVMCATLAATASAASASGHYTATTSGDYTATISPGSVAPGASTRFTVTLTNTSKANPLNAAIVLPPPGFAVTAVSRPSPSGNSSVSNGQVVLQGVSLHAGETETVEITATSPQSCKRVSWSTQAFKSSLQGVQLSLGRRDSSLATTVSCDSIITEPCAAKAACSPATVTTPTSSFTVSTGVGSSAGSLSASVNPGKPLVCGGYEGIDLNWYGFFESTFERDKTVTITVKDTWSLTYGVHLCFGAPYAFETLGDHPAPAGTLPDGSDGFVGLLEMCDNERERTPDPCVQSITTVRDKSVKSGFDTVVIATIPAELTGDPFVHP